MKNQATLLSENHNAKENTLFLAMELSRKKWKLGFNDGKQMRARIRTIAARDFQGLQREIELSKQHHAGDLQEKNRLSRMLEHKVCIFLFVRHCSLKCFYVVYRYLTCNAVLIQNHLL